MLIIVGTVFGVLLQNQMAEIRDELEREKAEKDHLTEQLRVAKERIGHVTEVRYYFGIDFFCFADCSTS